MMDTNYYYWIILQLLYTLIHLQTGFLLYSQCNSVLKQDKWESSFWIYHIIPLMFHSIHGNKSQKKYRFKRIKIKLGILEQVFSPNNAVAEIMVVMGVWDKPELCSQTLHQKRKKCRICCLREELKRMASHQ